MLVACSYEFGWMFSDIRHYCSDVLEQRKRECPAHRTFNTVPLQRQKKEATVLEAEIAWTDNSSGTMF